MGIFGKLFGTSRDSSDGVVPVQATPQRSVREQGREVPSLRYFHGGAPGLAIGDDILPRNYLSAWNGKTPTWRKGQPAQAFGDRGETVAITTDLAIAEAYAGQYLDPAGTGTRVPGQVYEVRPLAYTESDPDFVSSFPTIARVRKGARILALNGGLVPVEDNQRYLTKAIAPHVRWIDNHECVYDANGYIKMHEVWRRYGKTEDSLRALGPWIPIGLIDRGSAVPANLPALI